MIQNHGFVVRGLLPPGTPQVFTEDFDQAKRLVASQFISIAQRMLDAQNYKACTSSLLAAKSALSLRPMDIPRARPYWRAVSSQAVTVTISEVLSHAAATG